MPVPCYPVLPATLIGRLAVDQRYRGKGLGELLLLDALSRSLRSGIGSVAVVVDAKDANASRFYEYFGFRPIVGVHGRLYQMMKDIQIPLI
jgi:GNAT superfamily N-acetyltransferase